MKKQLDLYINGNWAKPVTGGEAFLIINPATEAVVGTMMMGTEDDVEIAIAAARNTFNLYSNTSLKDRRALLSKICNVYERRLDDMADAICTEMGAPLKKLARPVQAPLGLWHFQTALALSETYPFSVAQGSTMILKEAIGVCSLITPWNWPMGQVACKVAPALLAGCTMILKPSEYAPFSAQIFAEILDEAGVPRGVFNMVHGDGARLGPLMASHKDVDMVSLTGSTRSGTSVASNAADGLKRVSLELGGKSANIILDDAPLLESVTAGVVGMMTNSGQSCNAPSRMLVPRGRLFEAESIAAAALKKLVIGDPQNPDTVIGPLANKRQYDRVQLLISKGLEEGAHLVIGGLGLPEGLLSGFYTKPTIFSRAHNRMNISQEEIFGPVLTMIPYDSEEEAIAIANDTDFGLSGYVWGGSRSRAMDIAKRLRTGMVHVNGASADLAAPFGGYKKSGNGREWGVAGIEEFLETKAVMGGAPEPKIL